jgi:hypothetical protein
MYLVADTEDPLVTTGDLLIDEESSVMNRKLSQEIWDRRKGCIACESN